MFEKMLRWIGLVPAKRLLAAEDEIEFTIDQMEITRASMLEYREHADEARAALSAAWGELDALERKHAKEQSDLLRVHTLVMGELAEARVA